MTNDTNPDTTDDMADDADTDDDAMQDMHDATRAMYQDLADRGGIIGAIASKCLALIDRAEAYQSDGQDHE